MLYLPINTVFIEGPDCSGKTTLINDSFEKEINNLNNMYVILLPDFEEIRKRFYKRGDEIHDIDSLKVVYDKFSQFAKEVSSRPNVLIYDSRNSPKKLCENLYVYLDLAERPLIRELGDIVKKNVSCSEEKETYPLEFTLVDDGSFQEARRVSMDYPPEKEYYHKIYHDLHEKIESELAGNNEYERKEDFASRRFVYADTTCISFIQVAIRDGIMDFHTVIRSSNVKDILEHDIRFLYFLASTCYNKFSEKCQYARMRFNLNSAHIL